MDLGFEQIRFLLLVAGCLDNSFLPAQVLLRVRRALVPESSFWMEISVGFALRWIAFKAHGNAFYTFSLSSGESCQYLPSGKGITPALLSCFWLHRRCRGRELREGRRMLLGLLHLPSPFPGTGGGTSFCSVPSEARLGIAGSTILSFILLLFLPGLGRGVVRFLSAPGPD